MNEGTMNRKILVNLVKLKSSWQMLITNKLESLTLAWFADKLNVCKLRLFVNKNRSLHEWSTFHSRVGCWVLTLPTNIRLGWKGMPGKNILTRKLRTQRVFQNRGKFYNTFNIQNLRMFVISLRVCSWQAFPAYSNVWGKARSLP